MALSLNKQTKKIQNQKDNDTLQQLKFETIQKKKVCVLINEGKKKCIN